MYTLQYNFNVLWFFYQSPLYGKSDMVLYSIPWGFKVRVRAISFLKILSAHHMILPCLSRKRYLFTSETESKLFSYRTSCRFNLIDTDTMFCDDDDICSIYFLKRTHFSTNQNKKCSFQHQPWWAFVLSLVSAHQELKVNCKISHILHEKFLHQVLAQIIFHWLQNVLFQDQTNQQNWSVIMLNMSKCVLLCWRLTR